MNKKEQKYRAVFIDLDDTVWDYQKSALESFQELFCKFELSKYFHSVDHFLSIYTPRNRELWALYDKNEITKDFLQKERFRHPFAQVGYNDDTLPQQVGDFFLYNTSSKTNLVPYAKELLTYLHQRYRLTIVSNGFVEVQYTKLKSTGIFDLFSHVVLSEQIGFQKPHRTIFEYAMQLNGVVASEAIMIGDNYTADIAGAAASNIDQIYYAPLSNGEQKATYTVRHLSEIIDIL